MDRISLLIASVFLSFAATGCGHMFGLFGDDGPSEPTSSDSGEMGDAGPKNSSKEAVASRKEAVASRKDLELKLARLWTRVDELENKQIRQQEKIELLERGIMLGLVPEELKKERAASNGSMDNGGSRGRDERSSQNRRVPSPRRSRAPAEGRANVQAVEEDKSAGGGQHGTAQPQKRSQEQNEEYKNILAKAHDLYRQGRYGRAIVQFSKLGKKFEDADRGAMHIYWIAKCWKELKEYETARKHYTDFIEQHPSSPWVPRAKFDLAKTEWQMGYQETAVSRFRTLIENHPYEDAAEMAKMELKRLEQSL